MSRPRTATNILEARGAFKNHPGRGKDRENEPISDIKFPKNPPKHLTAKEKSCWCEVVGMTPAGVLTGADVLIVEIIAVLLSEFRKYREEFQTARLTRLTSEMGKIGLTPSSRAGLTVQKTKGNKYDNV